MLKLRVHISTSPLTATQGTSGLCEGLGHPSFGMGASRNDVIIGSSRSARFTTVTWEVPGSMASCEFGRPARRIAEDAAAEQTEHLNRVLRRTRSESPMIKRVGALIALMASAGRSLIC